MPLCCRAGAAMRITRSASKFEKRGIHLAVVQQDMPALSAAVAAPGAAINAALDGGVTALHIACAMNQVEDGGAMRLLLDRGADVNAHLSSNGLEIDLALRPIKQQNAPLFQQLVRRLQPLFSPLAVAVHSLHVGAVEVLLAGGADAGHVVHGRNLLNICQAASTWYSSATVTRIQALLVQHGVDCLGGYPAPPLGCAVDRHEREAVRIYMADLCRRQAAGNLLADDPVGWRLVTIMKAALMVKDAASLELFSPFIRRQDGCRAQYVSGGMVRLLEPAILADNLDVCGRLLDVGVSATDTIDHFWGRGNRPLDVAVAHSGEGIVRLLMEHGAQPEAKHILSAVSYWKPGVLRALLSGGTPQFDLSHVDARAVGSTFTCPVIELLYRHVQRGGRGVGAVSWGWKEQESEVGVACYDGGHAVQPVVRTAWTAGG